MKILFTLLLCPAACSAEPSPDPSTWGETYRLINGKIEGRGMVGIEVQDGKIRAIGVTNATLRTIDLHGATIQPGWIDSHVHLSYLPAVDEMVAGGVAAVVDLAAPIHALSTPPATLLVLPSGPMITARKGYPTQSWGSDGYGLEVAGPMEAAAAVDRLFAAGARLIKVPISRPALTDIELQAITDTAHAHDLRVAAHALSDADANRAARLGCDILAHTPTGELSEETLALWADRTVITTLSAFGGSPTAVSNLRRLKQHGTTILYGTDFGNTRTPGVNEEEISLMRAAGLREAEILASGTTVPAAYWHLDSYGSVEVGKRAVFRILP